MYLTQSNVIRKLSKSEYAMLREMCRYSNNLYNVAFYFYMAISFDYRVSGENIAKNVYSAGDIIDTWYASPHHQENLLNQSFRKIGISVCIDLTLPTAKAGGFLGRLAHGLNARRYIPKELTIGAPLFPKGEPNALYTVARRFPLARKHIFVKAEV